MTYLADVAGKVLSARQKDQEAAMCLILMC